MEQTAKYIVFRDRESGQFLTDYKNKGTLAYRGNFHEQIYRATTMPVEDFEKQKKRMKALAKAMNCEIVVVEATYNLKYLNGDEIKGPELTAEEEYEKRFWQFMNWYISAEGE